jgi:hypothetical protein
MIAIFTLEFINWHYQLLKTQLQLTINKLEGKINGLKPIREELSIHFYWEYF